MDLSYLIIAQQGGGADLLSTLLMFGVIFVIFWFILIRPQKKEMERHRQLLAGLKAGDKVVTAGGLFGIVKAVDGPVIELDLGRGNKVKIDRQKVQKMQDEFLNEADDGDEKEDSDKEED